MGDYPVVILQAFILFPIVAFLFTLPYVVFNYHKYGSVLSLRIIIVYSFILYLMCIYFLVILSFCLSLFFELTQLSELYFIYPRSYWLFDADDLLANTLGGVFGYAIISPFLKILPSRERIDKVSFHRGRQVSLTRRLVSAMFDLIVVAL